MEEKKATWLEPICHEPMAEGGMAQGLVLWVSIPVYLFSGLVWGKEKRSCLHFPYQVHSEHLMVNHCSPTSRGKSGERAITRFRFWVSFFFCFFLIVNQRPFIPETTGPVEDRGDSQGLKVAGFYVNPYTEQQDSLSLPRSQNFHSQV